MRNYLIATLLCTATAHAQLHPADPPVRAQSGMPFLTADAKGAVWLSWIDPLPGNQHALLYAKWTGTAWSRASTIATGKNWFVNWADFPALAALPDGSMLAHWLTRSAGGGTYGYGLRVARKAPDSEKWKEIFGASLDNKIDYAGFLSFAVSGNTAGAVYLAPPPEAPKSKASTHGQDGHDAAMGGEPEHRKTLRFVAFTSEGTVAGDREIDSDTCSCCQTTVVATPKGLVAAYRDHLPGEIRDISIVRMVDGAWTSPIPLHRDGWEINACPTDGPSAAASGEDVGIAWFTRAQNNARVQLALSTNSGATFTDPVRLDDGDPLGRPSVALFDDKQYLVGWLEKTVEGKAELRLRRVAMDGTKYPAVTVATVVAGRSTGLPKLMVAGDQIIVAWRDEQVRSGWYGRAQFLELEAARRTEH